MSTASTVTKEKLRIHKAELQPHSTDTHHKNKSGLGTIIALLLVAHFAEMVPCYSKPLSNQIPLKNSEESSFQARSMGINM